MFDQRVNCDTWLFFSCSENSFSRLNSFPLLWTPFVWSTSCFSSSSLSFSLFSWIPSYLCINMMNLTCLYYPVFISFLVYICVRVPIKGLFCDNYIIIMAYSFNNSQTRSVSKEELRILKPHLLIFWWWQSGKYGVNLGENQGKIMKKRETWILSTPLSNILEI